MEPRRVEEFEVVGEDRRLETVAECVGSQLNREGPPSFELVDFLGDLLQRHLDAEVAIHRVEACGSASAAVGLGVDGERGDDHRPAGGVFEPSDSSKGADEDARIGANVSSSASTTSHPNRPPTRRAWLSSSSIPT